MIVDPWPLKRSYAKRNTTCECCGGGQGTREHRPSPKPNDSNYVVAFCPKCDRG